MFILFPTTAMPARCADRSYAMAFSREGLIGSRWAFGHCETTSDKFGLTFPTWTWSSLRRHRGLSGAQVLFAGAEAEVSLVGSCEGGGHGCHRRRAGEYPGEGCHVVQEIAPGFADVERLHACPHSDGNEHHTDPEVVA
jgi:hypothetical protein